MKLINTKKIKFLLHNAGKKNIDLAKHLKISSSVICDALNGKRGLSMNYVFDLATFFDVEPLSLTVDNDTKQCSTKTSTTQTKKAS